MEEARRKLRICLFLVVAAAVLTGLIYYFGEMGSAGKVSEGTLVKRTAPVTMTVRVKTPGGAYGV